MMRSSGVLLTAMLAAMLTSAGLRAADEQIDRESLRSLDGVRVAVEDLPAGAPKDLNTDALRRFVESRLVAAQVPLQKPGEYPVGDPFLRITIKTTSENDDVTGYHVDVEFVQLVFLRRNPMLTFNRAQTWAAHARMGLAHRGQLTERVQRDLADEVDQFIAAYLAVNPN
jgi:hypothetical protein